MRALATILLLAAGCVADTRTPAGPSCALDVGEWRLSDSEQPPDTRCRPLPSRVEVLEVTACTAEVWHEGLTITLWGDEPPDRDITVFGEADDGRCVWRISARR